jgi:hypothetical protein
MRPKCEDGFERVEQLPTKARSARSLRLIVGLSIPVYLLVTWVIAVWVPGYSFFALIPAVFALYSAAVLLSGRKE